MSGYIPSMNAQQIAKQLAQKGHRPLAQSLVKADQATAADMDMITKFLDAVADGAKTAEAALRKGDKAKAYKYLAAAVLGNMVTVLSLMTDSTTEPKSVAPLRKARELIGK